MSEVIVQIAPDQESQTDAMRQAPFAAARKLGHTLEPIHPGSIDPALSRWFHMEVESDKAAALVKVLLNEPLVIAAYVKPQAEPP